MTDQNFKHSLDITSNKLNQHIPELLKGLWELGGMPEYAVELFERNISMRGVTVIDLGCGKGATLIALAKHFDIHGLGVDIVSSFIEEAERYAKVHLVSGKVVFKTEDLTKTICGILPQDLVIYGYDSETLGDFKSTLKELSKCVKEEGYLLLEFMFGDTPTEDLSTESEMVRVIKQTGYDLLDKIIWDKDTLIQVNRRNTGIIGANAERLSKQYPDKKELFVEYVQNQIGECEELENNHVCTLLLRKKTTVHYTDHLHLC